MLFDPKVHLYLAFSDHYRVLLEMEWEENGFVSGEAISTCIAG
jgi:hypothetical protein